MVGLSTAQREINKIDEESVNAKTLIAFVDSGIDIHHESFFYPDQITSKFAAIWDRGANEPQDALWRSSADNTYGVTIGRVFTNHEINGEISSSEKKILRCSEQNSRHATAVASIAVGSSVIDGNKWLSGVAPQIDILFIILCKKEKHGESKFIEILQFIHEFSKDKKRSIVVNFSFGYTFGTHDGTSPLESKINQVSKQGLIIVKSAGNERQAKSHIERMLPMGANSYFEWNVSNDFPKRSKCRILLVFSQFANMKFLLLKPLKVGEEERQASIWISQDMKQPVTVSFSDCIAELTYNTSDPQNVGCHTLDITISPDENGSVPVGIWKLEIDFQEFGNSEMEKSEKKIHAWLDCYPSNNNMRGIEFINVGVEDENTTLTIPGTSKHAIVVGSIDSKNGKIDPISSLGPTRDERNQPIIAAIGTNITVALAKDYSRGKHSSLSQIGGGTSYAAPRVAGAIALYLSDGGTAENVKDFIIQKYGPNWKKDLGYGVLC